MLLYLLLPVLSTVADLIELVSPALARKTRQHLDYRPILRVKTLCLDHQNIHIVTGVDHDLSHSRGRCTFIPRHARQQTDLRHANFERQGL